MNSRDGISMADPWGLITDALEVAIEKMEELKEFAAERKALDLDNPEDDRL
jgi:hypothetical protein